MMPTDQILFLDAQGRRKWLAGWTGPWPPPKRLIVARGEKSGRVTVIEEDADPEAIAAARALGSITFMPYRLRNCSQAPEPAPEGAHWFRGAEYVPEADDA